MKSAELKVLPVTVLKPAEYNPRKKLKPGDKEYEKIKASIEGKQVVKFIYIKGRLANLVVK